MAVPNNKMGTNVHSLREFSNNSAAGPYMQTNSLGNGSLAYGMFGANRQSAPPKCIDLFIPGFSWRSSIIWISIIQIIVFFVTCAVDLTPDLKPTGWSLSIFGSSFGPDIVRGQVWRIVTPIFLHATIWHLLFNVFFQTRMGIAVEQSYGLKKFILMYFLTGIAGNLFSVALAPCKYAVGASTAGFGIIGVNLAETVASWNSITNKDQVIFNTIFYAIIIIMMSVVPGSVVDWRGHLGGFIAGFCIGCLYNQELASRNRWLKQFSSYGAYILLATLYVTCTLVIFLVPMIDKNGVCIR